ncbi:hypothetical protein NLX83_02250 [Allokutzneria sp. A3M-2-11 16]|uniref:hypothetical protein n=1 Tax=Allokutzneria sp. A3M-2-11 16 TaxID=2962043 RepID=UPI0020B8E30A|nr:hypothetical protein [Allokutzneria sp. A3M-2-11 16]MCP3798070.1 hypothetical protein [Allokutzneria sp. A3M-2-11 16]
MSASDQAVPRQATVHSVLPDGSVTVLDDNGLLHDATAEAVRAGGWRAPRAGQRVALRHENGAIVAVLPPAQP